jgi:hypothetical protein
MPELTTHLFLVLNLQAGDMDLHIRPALSVDFGYARSLDDPTIITLYKFVTYLNLHECTEILVMT